MSLLSKTKLVLFFTHGVSLKAWNDAGLFDREIEIYRRLLPYMGEILFLSYGNRGELHFLERLGNIRILYNKWGLSHRCFSIMAPILYWRELKNATVFKAHQWHGSRTAVIAKLLFGKKLVVRCGYLLSVFREKAGHAYLARAEARVEEAIGASIADRMIVPGIAEKNYLVDRYRIGNEDKIVMIPNYIDTSVFKPLPNIKREKGRICFVGRLHPQKNALALLEALRGLDGVSLIMLGRGPLREKLEEKAREWDINVEFLGIIPNYQLPTELNASSLYILPSLYEGSSPKTLLEAMACGLPVIGTNVWGIRDVLVHKQTGYVCGTSAKEIRQAVLEVLGSEQLKTEMGRKARDFVVENFSIDKILGLELDLLRSLVEGGGEK